MLRKAVVTTIALGALLLLTAPGAASAAGVNGTWTGGKTSDFYYFSPSIVIAKSGGRYVGTSTTDVSWTLPGHQGSIGGLSNSCDIPAATRVLRLRPQRGRRNTFTGSVILIYNLLTAGPGSTDVPFACQTHLFGAVVRLASNGRSFRLRSIDGPDTFPTVTYRKGK
jgi:hypothetical protein